MSDDADKLLTDEWRKRVKQLEEMLEYAYFTTTATIILALSYSDDGVRALAHELTKMSLVLHDALDHTHSNCSLKHNKDPRMQLLLKVAHREFNEWIAKRKARNDSSNE